MLRRDVKPIYTAATPDTTQHARDEMLEHWAGKYPAIRSLWLNAWEQFIPFLDYDVEIREGHLLHQRNREPERQVPPLHSRQRPLPWANKQP